MLVLLAGCSSGGDASVVEDLELGSAAAVELRDDLLATAPGWSGWLDDRPVEERVVLWDSLASVGELQCDFIDEAELAVEVELAGITFFGELLDSGQAGIFEDEIGNYDLFLDAADRVFCDSWYGSLQTARVVSS